MKDNKTRSGNAAEDTSSGDSSASQIKPLAKKRGRPAKKEKRTKATTIFWTDHEYSELQRIAERVFREADKIGDLEASPLTSEGSSRMSDKHKVAALIRGAVIGYLSAPSLLPSTSKRAAAYRIAWLAEFKR